MYTMANVLTIYRRKFGTVIVILVASDVKQSEK